MIYENTEGWRDNMAESKKKKIDPAGKGKTDNITDGEIKEISKVNKDEAPTDLTPEKDLFPASVG